jgi:hypothetical protein
MNALQATRPASTVRQFIGQSSSADPRETAETLQPISNFTGALDATSVSHDTMDYRLYAARADFKILASQVAMHLPDQWREKLFKQIDSTLDSEQWEAEDCPPTVFSARTFLRLILALKTTVRPGLGATHDGNLVAAWTNGKNRLTVECLGGDRIRWSVVREIAEGEEVDRGVGATVIGRFIALLAPYGPETWFAGGKRQD